MTGDQLATQGNEPIPTSLPNGERPVTSDTNLTDAREIEADYIITTDSPNDVNDAAQRGNEGMKNDVSNRNEGNKAEKNENSLAGFGRWPQKQRKNFARFVRKTRKWWQLFGREFFW